ncbi:MAG: FtsW/RodA/SpoVE family cell cycle protein [Pseudomonadota bacterium]|nr:FtsW/RodA/SpoVE family cell cycle protein [Pseudomonadota bacterium]
MILLLVELILLCAVALAGWFGARFAIDGTLATAAARAQTGDSALVRAAGDEAALWFAGGLLLLALVRGATGLRGGRHIRTPLLLPAIGAAAGLGLVVQLGYGSPFRADWPGPGFAQGVFYGCVAASSILALPGDIGAWISRGRWLIGGGALALLVALALFGESPGRSGQRINLFGTQPIELVKVGAVLFAADALGRRAGKIRFQRVRAGILRLPRPTLLVPALVALLATWAGLFLVKDLGPTLILAAVFLGLFYLATRSPGWVMLALGTFGTTLALLAVSPELAPAGTVQTRLRMWADPWLNGLPNGDQLALGFWAMAAGGWNGSGLGTAFPGGIPAGHTDLVYAHLIEELGVLGGLAWLVLLGVAVTDGLRVAARNRTPERALMAAGLGMLVVAQAATILGGTFGVIPLTGVVVPFLSFGKTSMVAFWAIAALLARLGDDGEARVATDELREIAGGVRHVQIAVGTLTALGLVATLLAAVVGRDETSLRGVVTTLADGTPVLLQDRRLSSIAAAIRRGDILDRNDQPLATSPVAGTRENPLGDALGTVLGPAGGGLLRAKWSIERQQEARLRGYPDKADGPAIWLGAVGDVERLLLAVPSAANEATSERAHAQAAYTRLGGAPPSGTGADRIRRVALATPDLATLLPLARLPLVEREAAIQVLSADVAQRSVKLTLDARLQAAIAPLVRAAAAKSSVGAAALVVLDPATGEVLARAQWPDYDPSGAAWRKQRLAADPKFMGIYGAWSDKTGAHGVWQAGSVFKVLSAVAAAKAGRVEATAARTSQADSTSSTCPAAASPRFPCNTMHDGRPSFTLPAWSRPIHDHGDGGARGDLDLVAAITKSSNVFFGQLALDLGPEAYRALRAAGVEFGNPGLDQERDGDFTGLGALGSRRLAQTGFGQGAGSWNVTQAARLVGAVAAGGTYRRCPPDLAFGGVCTAAPLLDAPEALAPVLAGMEGVMRSGTGARLPKVPGVRIYGKTGTADAPGTRDEAPWKIRPAQVTLPHSWFVAIAEPDAAPSCGAETPGRYVVTAVVPHGGFGASAAGPLAVAAIKELRTLGYLPAATTAATP